MAMFPAICTLFVLAAVQQNMGFILDDKADCQMTLWTAWSEPVGYGSAWRERRINQYPTGGGNPCPAETLQVRLSGTGSIDGQFKPLPLSITATLIIENFLRPFVQQSEKRSTKPGTRYRDLVLIVDSSASIGSTNFNTSLNELIVLLKSMCPYQHTFDSMYNRAAIITFSTTASVIFDLDDYQTTTEVYEAIHKTPYHSGSTHTDLAFKTAETLFQTSRGARISDPTVTQEVLILSDGHSNNPQAAITAAHHLNSMADVYALTIGQPSYQEMYSYVSKPQAKHLFAMQGYQDLSKLLHEILQQLRTHPGIPCTPFNG